jgi:hypothetical protein
MIQQRPNCQNCTFGHELAIGRTICFGENYADWLSSKYRRWTVVRRRQEKERKAQTWGRLNETRLDCAVLISPWTFSLSLITQDTQEEIHDGRSLCSIFFFFSVLTIVG